MMPDHVHLLFTPLRDEKGWPYGLPAILKFLKGCSARNINKFLGSGGPVWQQESFDHVLRPQRASKRSWNTSGRKRCGEDCCRSPNITDGYGSSRLVGRTLLSVAFEVGLVPAVSGESISKVKSKIKSDGQECPFHNGRAILALCLGFRNQVRRKRFTWRPSGAR